MKQMILTGATGAVGHGLIEACLARGIGVTAVCRRDSARTRFLPEHPLLTIVPCNLSELDLLPEILEGKRFDAFCHMGWDGTFGADRNQLYGQEQNIRFTLDAVRVAHRLGCNVFLGTGSQAEYGRMTEKLTPDTPVCPETPYGITKLCAGQLSRLLCEELGMRHVWARLLSIYGPGDRRQTMIMSVIGALLCGQQPALSKGEQIWDYLYGRDAGEALLALLENGVHGKSYPVGSGEARPLREYVEEIRNAINPELALGFGEIPYHLRQVMYLSADLTELTADTGFRPSVSFAEGIWETIAWYRKEFL